MPKKKASIDRQSMLDTFVKEFIPAHEGGEHGYNVRYGDKPIEARTNEEGEVVTPERSNLLAKQSYYYGAPYSLVSKIKTLPEMTKAEAIKYQGLVRKPVSEGGLRRPGVRREDTSTAIGIAQFMKKTLKDDKALKDTDLMTPENQHKVMKDLIMRKRKGKEFVGDKKSKEEMIINLSKEWAAVPVPKDMQGAYGFVPKGQSYYFKPKRTYTVKKGDTLKKISRKLRRYRNSSLGLLTKNNDIKDISKIKVGQTLKYGRSLNKAQPGSLEEMNKIFNISGEKKKKKKGKSYLDFTGSKYTITKKKKPSDKIKRLEEFLQGGK